MSSSELQDRTFVLVTGANSGLGFSVCCRLIDEFLSARPESQQLTIVYTTRDSKKGNDTRVRLEEHLRHAYAYHGQSPDDAQEETNSSSPRVTFISENVDLTDLVSVRALSRRLLKDVPKLDAIVLNAGLGGWTGIDWPKAIWEVMTDTLHAVSWPTYKVGQVGVVTKKQTSSLLASSGEKGEKKEIEEPRLGTIFCANVFGHYMLAHNVVPLLKRSAKPNGPGRIIWVSSLEGTIKLFDPEDIQGLRSEYAYESSKALTDILALTSNLPSTAPWVNSFLSVEDDKSSTKSQQEEKEVNIYLTHPGICATSILPLPFPLVYLMLISFWLARILGSPWHTLSTYAGAIAPVWLSLSPQHVLDDAESPYIRHGGGGRAKWGSSCDRLGRESCASSEVDGWGYGGVVGPAVVEEDRRRMRKRGATDLTREEREKFEELGRRCWQEMEELRIRWDRILDEAEGLAQ
ncbi:hypothetical protein VTN00DRAFT_10295 [Thermoascus crustaceus]|uniref:uncharacterized protein n=1 Tax=Thermoascus crustaceus TaxID=5088 RepID=UPI003742904F